jgi:type VI secretion system ImpM family protein
LEVGLYGKLPTHGDFLRRRITDEFVTAWDAWLQASMASSRSLLGDGWLNVYLTSPAWRFACSAGACGPAVAGLMVPSVDRVGRYFPITLTWQPPDDLTPVDVATRSNHWFNAAERHVIETLSREYVDFEAFDERLVALGRELDDVCGPMRVKLDSADAESLTASRAAKWHVPIGSPGEIACVFEQLLYHRLRTAFEPLVLWWTEGSSMVEPSCLITTRLPAPESFVAFLDGSWSECGWRTAGATVIASETFADTLVEDEQISQYLSAGLSETGRVRQMNQDAFLERPEVGMWVVADGMGGHEAGDVASRAVCDAVADVPPGDTLEGTIDLVRGRLEEVNTHLRRAAQRSVDSLQSGSTVVVMLARRTRVAVLWAGDSRAYRLRAGSLHPLTRDHTWTSELNDGPAIVDEAHRAESAFAITRAVGGTDTLDLDLQRDRVRKGDRYLLCSDGLTRELDDAQLVSILSDGDAAACARRLVQATIDAGARDNVTVVVIDAL